jgi:hypothetical protein
MDKDTRARIAFAVGRVLSGTTKGGIYDHAERRHRMIIGSCSRESIHVYDQHAATHIKGAGDGVDFNLYDEGRGAHMSLSFRGSGFSGYDHGSGHKFSGIAIGTAIQLYDESDGSWSYYTG